MALPVSETILPAGEHRKLVIRTCAVRHLVELVVAKARTKADWDSTMKRMVVRGAVASEKEQTQILDYLNQHVGH